MAENEQTKICPLCAEIIKVAAKVCPRCRSRLQPTKNALVVWLQLLAIVILFYGPMLLAARWVRDSKLPGQSFEPSREKIAVFDTTMHYSQSDKTNIISTVGYLRNDSSNSWQALQLEVQYFDSGGKLVDTKTETLQYQELPMGMTEAFRIRAAAAAAESSYVSNKVFVRMAKDARKIWSAKN